LALLVPISFAAFILASLVLGLRLLALSRRTGELPELAIAIDFLAAGVVGYGLLAALGVQAVPGPWYDAARIACSAGLALGAGAVAVFTREVFRPKEGWALLFVVAILGALFWSTSVTALVPRGPGLSHVPAPEFWAGTFGNFASYGWTAAESARWRRLLRRRARVGVAVDAVVANRLLLWAVASLAVCTVAGVYAVVRLAGLDDPPPPVLVGCAACVLVAALANALAFLPPAAYRRWLLSGARPAAA